LILILQRDRQTVSGWTDGRIATLLITAPTVGRGHDKAMVHCRLRPGAPARRACLALAPSVV